MDQPTIAPVSPHESSRLYTITLFDNRFKKFGYKITRDLAGMREIFRQHLERENKDGVGFLAGTFENDRRKKDNTLVIDALVFDSDGIPPQRLEEVVALLEKLGIFAWVYTTHSHRSESTHKLRIVILLKTPMVFAELSTDHADACRIFMHIYNAVGRSIGLAFDRSCTDPSRLFYLPSHPPSRDDSTVIETDGQLFDWTAVDRPASQPKERKQSRRATNSTVQDGHDADRWRGFKAADAAIELLKAMDKRQEDPPMAILDCGFVEEHQTSKTGKGQLMLINAQDGEHLPIAKCKSNTCEERPYVEHLDRLFDHEEVRAIPEFWHVSEEYDLPLAGGFVVPLGKKMAALREMNKHWSVIKTGGRTRYHNLQASGVPEFLTKSAFTDWYEAAYFEYLDARGNRKLGSLARLSQRV